MPTIDELRTHLRKPVEVPCAPLGALQLRPLLDDERDVLKTLLAEDLQGRESVVRVMHWLLVSPALTLDDICALSDDELVEVIKAWSANPRALGQALPDSAVPFDTFRQELLEWAQHDPTQALRDELAKVQQSALGAIQVPDIGAQLSKQMAAINAEALKPAFDSNQFTTLQSSLATEAAASLQAGLDRAAAFRFDHLDWAAAAARDAASSMLSVIGQPTSAASSALEAMQAAVERDQALFNRLVAPMPNLDAMAKAVESARAWLPDVSTLSALQGIAEQLSSMQQSWRTADLESLRVGAGVLGQVSALAQQDWLLNWPPPSLAEHWKELDEAKQTLDAHGYGYTIDLWRWAFLRTLVRPMHPRMQARVITRRLTQATQEPEFKSYMEALMRDLESLPYMSRVHLKPRTRSRAIAQALDAHARKHYLASVPVLLAQVDGMLTCVLLARGELWVGKDKWGKKIYKGKNQTTGREIEATSLRKRLDCTQIQSDPVLGALKELLDNRLDDRNYILHGDDTTYGTSKLSTQLVLVLAVLANELAEYAQTQTKH